MTLFLMHLGVALFIGVALSGRPKALIAAASVNALLYIILAATAAKASDSTRVDLNGRTVKTYSTLHVPDQSKVLVLKDEVADANMSVLSESLKSMTKTPSSNPVFLVIDSPGGSVDAGMNFINTMRAAKEARNVKVTCVITSRAYSMAAIIAAACHKTYILPTADMMFHNVTYGVRGTPALIKSRTTHMESYIKELEALIASQLGMPLSTYEALTRDELWLTARQAAAKGFVDGIVQTFFYTATPPVIKENPFSIFFHYDKLLPGVRR